ncbi:MAG: sugar transferase, partial [Candidatus Omnitrophota bacterium]
MLLFIRLIIGIAKSYCGDIVKLAGQRRKKRRCISLFFKRTIDLVFSFIGLIFFSPLMLIAGIMVKLNSPGPIIYKQNRTGMDGKVFTMYKIRTMVRDAELFTGPIWSKKDDPRLVKRGDLLRKYHIDELPQLFNVLKGEMSLVGPRPERPEIIEKLESAIPDYKTRFTVKPGITGYAQILHKYDEEMRDVRLKLKYEIFYIKKMCVLMDIKIISKTLVTILMGKGEYQRKKGV